MPENEHECSQSSSEGRYGPRDRHVVDAAPDEASVRSASSQTRLALGTDGVILTMEFWCIARFRA